MIAPIKTKLTWRATEATWSFGRFMEGNRDTPCTISWVTMSDDVDVESLERTAPTRFATDYGASFVNRGSS